MCRFFAARAQGPTAFHDSLFASATAIARQSTCCRRGEAHEDGWGIVTYRDGQPQILKSTLPAHADPDFVRQAQAVCSTVTLAHIRQASVGHVSPENVHPFVYRQWAFAHNGTLQHFTGRRAKILEAIDADLRDQIRGSTDSEHILYFFLTHLRNRGNDLDQDVGFREVLQALRETLLQLDAWFPTHNGTDSKLNLLVTDGRLIAASCWRHSLWMLQDPDPDPGGAKPGRSPCETATPRVLIASEPTEDGLWSEIADRTLICVDEQLTPHLEPL